MLGLRSYGKLIALTFVEVYTFLEGLARDNFYAKIKRMIKRKPSHTRRYQETERRLLVVAYKISKPLRETRITVRELVRRARISVSTFYRHFRSLLDFSRKHERVLVKAAEQLLVELSQKDLSKEAVFFRINRMFYLNRASVQFLLANNNDRAIRRAFWVLRPLITKEWPVYGKECDQKIYCFFVAEATETVKLWAISYHFWQNYIDDVTRQLVFIAKIIAPALAPMVKMEEERGLKVMKDYY